MSHDPEDRSATDRQGDAVLAARLKYAERAQEWPPAPRSAPKSRQTPTTLPKAS